MQAFKRVVMTISGVVFTISRFAAYLSAGICIFMLVHILVEIVLRSFFDTSTFSMDEFVGYGVGAMAFLALGYSLETGALIRINILIKHLTGWIRWAIEVFTCFATLFATGIPIVFFWRSIVRHYERGYTSGTYYDVPSWLPESFLLVGLILFWIQLLAYTLRVLTNQQDLRTDRAVRLGID